MVVEPIHQPTTNLMAIDSRREVQHSTSLFFLSLSVQRDAQGMGGLRGDFETVIGAAAYQPKDSSIGIHLNITYKPVDQHLSAP